MDPEKEAFEMTSGKGHRYKNSNDSGDEDSNCWHLLMFSYILSTTVRFSFYTLFHLILTKLL